MNTITLYRLIAVPVLLLLIFTHQVNVFKWLLAISFFTDLLDGWLARSYKVTSIMGAKLDSVADDCTIVAAIIGVVVLKPEFLKQQILLVGILLAFFIIETIMALVQYMKTRERFTGIGQVLTMPLFFICAKMSDLTKITSNGYN